MSLLPVTEILPRVLSSLEQSPNLVLLAPPGSGKTTRVPLALLKGNAAEQREILVLQPRRLATRLAARYVASLLGEALGKTVGYQVRFEDVGSPATRLRYVTEGILERKLLANPDLHGVGTVVLDEFHERHLAGDLCLALLRSLQQTRRPDLKLLVMSATLDAEPIREFLGDCPVLKAQGRLFDVAVELLPAPDSRPLEQQVLSALKRLHSSGRLNGHVLVFLPGAKEIRRTSEACNEFAVRHGMEIRPLHGDLPVDEQDRAVAPSNRPKLILSTNVAETSITIDGVTAVVDGGWARFAFHSPWSGLPSLNLGRISKSSAAQRAGRAGRTAPGLCLRLYTQHEFTSFRDQDAPEIERADLAETLLTLRCMGISDVSRLSFLEAPPEAAVRAAETLLSRLGAIGRDSQITQLGTQMAALPIHPRLAALIGQGKRLGVGDDSLCLAALLGERDIRTHARVKFGSSKTRAPSALQAGASDVLELLDQFQEARKSSFHPHRLRELGLDPAATLSAERTRQQLARYMRGDSRHAPLHNEPGSEEALRKALLAAYPDRVAKRRSATSKEVLLYGGGVATFEEVDAHLSEWLVAVDVQEQAGSKPSVRWVSAIEPEWLLEFAEDLKSEESLEWNVQTERVDTVSRLSYGNLVLEETRKPASASNEATQLLWKAMCSADEKRFVDPELLEQWRGRVEFLRGIRPEAGFPTADRRFVEEQFRRMCENRTSLVELEHGLLEQLHAGLTPEQQRLLHTHAPERIALAKGRQVKIHYQIGKPPWIESRLQDFFGMQQGPKVGGGPLVLHLLAPNHRPVQVTTDLNGFWVRHYPSIRKELSRKYPRHSWPEDPTRTPSPSGRGSG